ncbi:MAG TPA: hypothetical protein VFO37_10240, partial [Chitinophagaceae bacterium]|nr:hypothetical protein [Chitinophagaceae bacterium]
AIDLNSELLKSLLIKSELVSFWQAVNVITATDTNAVISLGGTIIKNIFRVKQYTLPDKHILLIC